MREDILKINPPLFMIGMKIWCWRCNSKMPVIALLAPDIEGAEGKICLLSDIIKIPTDEEEAKSLYITEIPLSGSITVKASVNMGVGDLILKNAQKV